MMDRGEILEGARLQNEAYEGLKHQILSLDIEPGEMLSESILSSQMNVAKKVEDAVLARWRSWLKKDMLWFILKRARRSL